MAGTSPSRESRPILHRVPGMPMAVSSNVAKRRMRLIGTAGSRRSGIDPAERFAERLVSLGSHSASLGAVVVECIIGFATAVAVSHCDRGKLAGELKGGS